MGKRKQQKDGDRPSREKNEDSEDSGSDDDTEMLNVEFEWFDPQPAVDFHGLKTLLRQLLDVDAQLFDLSALTDLILSQPLLGSTVKVDGNETDPYAFLSVLNLQEHKDKAVIRDLTSYLKRRSSTNPNLSSLLEILSRPSIPPIGLVLTEKFINIPSEVVPPMYTMLLEEISWALEEKEPYSFTHYLILSKTYEEVASKLDAEDDRPKKKKKNADQNKELFYFHPEDEVFQRHAAAFGSFEYDRPQDEGQSDSKRAFQELGIKPKGYLILIEGSKFDGAVKAVAEYLNPSN